MKKIISKTGATLILSILLMSCGGNPTPSETATSSETTKVDVCKCLSEPGDSEWMKKNNNACREAISKEIGVENWENVNMAQNPEISAKFDALAERCIGKKETGIKSIDENNKLVPNIGTSSGYIYESINPQAQLYTTLAFDGLVFRTTAYAMNGKTNSEDFTKMIDMSGSWTAVDSKNAKGVIANSNVPVSWVFSSDYSTLKNNKGVVFKRVKVK